LRRCVAQDKLRKDEEDPQPERSCSRTREGVFGSSREFRLNAEEASQRAESRESSRNRELSQPRPARGDSVEVLARRKAEERVRHRSQERRKEEERIRAREAFQKCEVEEELRMAKEELEQRRRSAALRAASRQRREKETEERLRQERDEQTAAAKERRLLYRNPKAIAELKASEPQMPLTSEQRRSQSRRRQAEQARSPTQSESQRPFFTEK